MNNIEIKKTHKLDVEEYFDKDHIPKHNKLIDGEEYVNFTECLRLMKSFSDFVLSKILNNLELKEVARDYWQIKINGVDFGTWEKSQIRDLIETLDNAIHH